MTLSTAEKAKRFKILHAVPGLFCQSFRKL